MFDAPVKDSHLRIFTSGEDLYEEMLAAIDSARTAVHELYDGGEIVIVSHQLPIWLTRLSAEGRPLPHDPRKRQCNLGSLTSLHFTDLDSGRRPAVTYAEPSAHLYSGVNQLPGS